MEWDLLRGVPSEDVRRVLAAARRRRFERREVLFHEGDPATTLHLIDKGRVAVRVTTPLGDVATLAVLVAGDVLGELALLSGDSQRTATVAALEPTETLVIDQEAFRALLRSTPSMTTALLQAFAARVRELDARLLEALYVPAEVRLFRRLLELAETYGDVVPLTQDDLAGMAGTTRATVNRLLRKEDRRAQSLSVAVGSACSTGRHWPAGPDHDRGLARPCGRPRRIRLTRGSPAAQPLRRRSRRRGRL